MRVIAQVVAVAAAWCVGAASFEPLQLWVERSKVYGVELTAKPWDANACLRLTNYVAAVKFLKSIGARKSLVMAEYAKRTDNAEALREVSNAWDRDTDPEVFAQECVDKVIKFQSQQFKGDKT